MGIKVLIVDDSLDLRSLLSRFLNGQGFITAEAADGRAALDYLGTNDRPDLILLDCEMNVMSGAEFLDLLDELHPQLPKQVPIIGISGHRGFAHRNLTKSLRKPVDFDELEASIVSAVDHVMQSNLGF